VRILDEEDDMARSVLRTALAAGAAALVTLTAAAAPAVAARPGPPPPGKPVTVMTRNLYLGADINRPVEAALAAAQAGGDTTQVVQALAVATDYTRRIVDRTDFPTRATLLAGEISTTRPDLVGLQEVALWRSGTLELDETLLGVPNATTVDYDFLQLLLDALAANGTPYSPVVVGTRADVESPSFTPTFGDARDIRLTMRDVILTRADTRSIRVLGTGDQLYDQNLSVDIGGLTRDFARGYQWADVRMGSHTFRFVNTHLEAFSSDLALAQAAQAVEEATAPTGTTVFVCDCNSDPQDESVKVDIGDTQPHKAAYDFITGAGGYTDEWLEWAPAEDGWTSGLSETVDDTTADGFDHRIDMVFAHTSDGEPLAVDRGAVTGDTLADRDPGTGLWPSDHAGVVLRLRGL
jgi:endonuclease/exonuclease/phosphatase family metal-dependent hydrolase